MPRRRPLSDRTHEKRGPCALCGNVTDLTDTHVPPRAAFNQGLAYRPTIVKTYNGDVIDRGRQRQGGIRTWGHCPRCHAETSKWDDEYIKWARASADILVARRGNGLSDPGPIPVRLPCARPARFIRAALAGMAAAARDLNVTHPDVVAAIRTGRPVDPPADLRFLVAFTDTRHPTVQGIHGGLSITVPVRSHTVRHHSGLDIIGGLNEPTLSAITHFPPFSLILADAAIARRYPHEDHTDWLAEDADDDCREVNVLWPVVEWHNRSSMSPTAFS